MNMRPTLTFEHYVAEQKSFGRRLRTKADHQAFKAEWNELVGQNQPLHCQTPVLLPTEQHDRTHNDAQPATKKRKFIIAPEPPPVEQDHEKEPGPQPHENYFANIPTLSELLPGVDFDDFENDTYLANPSTSQNSNLPNITDTSGMPFDLSRQFLFFSHASNPPHNALLNPASNATTTGNIDHRKKTPRMHQYTSSNQFMQIDRNTARPRHTLFNTKIPKNSQETIMLQVEYFMRVCAKCKKAYDNKKLKNDASREKNSRFSEQLVQNRTNVKQYVLYLQGINAALTNGMKLIFEYPNGCNIYLMRSQEGPDLQYKLSSRSQLYLYRRDGSVYFRTQEGIFSLGDIRMLALLPQSKFVQPKDDPMPCAEKEICESVLQYTSKKGYTNPKSQRTPFNRIYSLSIQLTPDEILPLVKWDDVDKKCHPYKENFLIQGSISDDLIEKVQKNTEKRPAAPNLPIATAPQTARSTEETREITQTIAENSSPPRTGSLGFYSDGINRRLPSNEPRNVLSATNSPELLNVNASNSYK